MKGRPNNISKTLVRSKSPPLPASKPESAANKIHEKNMVSTHIELHRFSSTDAKIRPHPKEEPRSEKKAVELSKFREPNFKDPDFTPRNLKMEKNGKNLKDEDDNTT
jgi:hypothetical protein